MGVEYHFDHRGQVELKPGKPKRSLCWLYFILFILLQAGLGGWLYLNGYLTPVDAVTGMAVPSLRTQLDRQEQQLARQSAEIERLSTRLAAVKRAEAIQSATMEALQKKLVLATTELNESRDRLLLYEEVLSTSSARGLNIQHLDIKQLLIDDAGKKLAHNRHYQYHLILTNVRGETAQVEGQFALSLRGKQQGKTVSLSLDALVIAGRDGQSSELADNAFAFKHYQGLAGNIELPVGFVPEQVIVELLPVSGKKVRRQYDWSVFVPQ